MVTVYYLELAHSEPLQAKAQPAVELLIEEAQIPQYQLNRYLYQLVGNAWQWFDKLNWSDQQWATYVDDPNKRTWVARHRGTVAGYFELHRHGDSIDIGYFGLAPSFLEMGLGGYLLSEAIRRARDWGGSKVTVNTCTLDHPAALKNYLARGMRIVKTVDCAD